MEDKIINLADYDEIIVAYSYKNKPYIVEYMARYYSIKNQLYLVSSILQATLGLGEHESGWQSDEFIVKAYEAVRECYTKLCEYEDKYSVYEQYKKATGDDK